VKQFWPEMVGFKYKMSNLQAAIGCAQLERIEELILRKREILSAYRDRLESLPGVSMNPEPPGTVNGAWMPTVVFALETGITRERLQKAFLVEHIDARVFFYPLSSLSIFEPVLSNYLAWEIPSRAINLPSYHDLTLSEQDRVIEVLRSCLV
jgi:perosamine synthetase